MNKMATERTKNHIWFTTRK